MAHSDEFFEGREAIRDLLKRKWELDYRLEKNLWCFTENRIAVRFAYESRDDEEQCWRSHPTTGSQQNSASSPPRTGPRRSRWPSRGRASAHTGPRLPVGCFQLLEAAPIAGARWSHKPPEKYAIWMRRLLPLPRYAALVVNTA